MINFLNRDKTITTMILFKTSLLSLYHKKLFKICINIKEIFCCLNKYLKNMLN